MTRGHSQTILHTCSTVKKKITGLHFCICVVLSSTLNKLWIFMSYFIKQYGFNTRSVISRGWIVLYFYRQYGSFHRKFISRAFACVVLMQAVRFFTISWSPAFSKTVLLGHVVWFWCNTFYINDDLSCTFPEVMQYGLKKTCLNHTLLCSMARIFQGAPQFSTWRWVKTNRCLRTPETVQKPHLWVSLLNL